MRIVVAGQFPPPVTGQNVMIRELWSDLKKLTPQVKVDHLPMNFSRGMQDMRRASFSKLIALIEVLWRLFGLRIKGEIDLTIYPVGGPHMAPTIRDLLLLPWIYLCSRGVAIHFHAAGIEEFLTRRHAWFASLVKWMYGKADVGIVMTEYCRKDPEYLGIRNIKVIPHQIEDEYDERFVKRGNTIPRILYIGHLDKEKGVLDLVHALGILKRDGIEFECIMAGEGFPSLSMEELRKAIDREGVVERVSLPGPVYGDEKKRLFGSSHILVFPSKALESFGLVQIEGLMWGMMVISADWRGNKEILGRAGLGSLCVEAGAELSKNMARKIRELLCKKEEWQAMNEKARDGFIKNYKKDSSSSNLACSIVECDLR